MHGLIIVTLLIQAVNEGFLMLPIIAAHFDSPLPSTGGRDTSTISRGSSASSASSSQGGGEDPLTLQAGGADTSTEDYSSATSSDAATSVIWGSSGAGSGMDDTYGGNIMDGFVRAAICYCRLKRIIHALMCGFAVPERLPRSCLVHRGTCNRPRLSRPLGTERP